MLPKADCEIQVWLNCGFFFNSSSNPKPLLHNFREKGWWFSFLQFQLLWNRLNETLFFAIESKISLPGHYSCSLLKRSCIKWGTGATPYNLFKINVKHYHKKKTRLISGKRCWHFYGKLLHLHFRQANQFNSLGWIRQFNDTNAD